MSCSCKPSQLPVVPRAPLASHHVADAYLQCTRQPACSVYILLHPRNGSVQCCWVVFIPEVLLWYSFTGCASQPHLMHLLKSLVTLMVTF